MSARARRSVLLAGVAALMAVSLALGCGRETSGPIVRFEPDGGVYTADDLEEAAAGVEVPGGGAYEAAGTAAETRAEALAELRASGDDGERVADLLTTGFPDDDPAVPLLVESCTFEGTDAFLVVEGWHQRDDVRRRRVWVFDAATGAILSSAALRTSD